MSLFRCSLRFVPFLMIGLTGFGCAANRYSAEDSVSRTFSTKTTPRIIVDTFAGTINVVVEGNGPVKAKVTKHAGGASQEAADEDLRNVEVSRSETDEVLRMAARAADLSAFSNRSADVELRVPEGSVLELHTSNGRIDATGKSGNILARSSNGKIAITGCGGKLDVETSNGDISLEKGADRVDAKTSNGNIAIKAVRGLVHGETSNGSIDFYGELTPGKHSFQTSNGKISLSLPASSSFRVDADTSMGEVTSEFETRIDEKSESKKDDKKAAKKTTRKPKVPGKDKQLHGTVGDNPDVSIKIHTSMGSIRILKEK
jgi:DUF4097 and DUF4098 domain-containing protein YvlB